MKAEAANSFLKTLEEPPPQTLFLLLVDSLSSVLPTIISRCQVINAGGMRKLAEPWHSTVLNLLSNIQEKSALLDTVRAEVLCSVLDDMAARAEKEVKEERKGRPIVDDEETLSALIGAKVKAWRSDLLLTFELWMRDLMHLNAAGDITDIPLNFPEYRACLLNRAKVYSLARLLENLTMLEQCSIHLERNITPAQILPYWMDRFYL
jgi:DNA polymerase-3 subunit delta'